MSVHGRALYAGALGQCEDGRPGRADDAMQLDRRLDNATAGLLLALGPLFQLVFSAHFNHVQLCKMIIDNAAAANQDTSMYMKIGRLQ
jgi:hypothetical protein